MASNTHYEAAFRAIKTKIESSLRLIDHRIASMQESMVGDYLRFFEVESEKMYQEHARRKFYLELSERFENISSKDPVAWLLNMAQRKTNEIARGQLSRNSTSQMANHAHLLTLEVTQQLITEIEGLAYIGQHAAD